MAFRQYALQNPGLQFDRLDIERVGLFTNPPGLSTQTKKYNKNVEAKKPENSRYIGAQMMTNNLKTKDGTMVGYFDTEYKRIFIKEAISKPSKKKKEKSLIILPTNPTKKHATPGDYYGCFANYTHFRLEWNKKKEKRKKESPNCSIAPNGYFSPYPKYFDPRLSRAALKSIKKRKPPLALYLNHPTADYFEPNPYFVENPKSTYEAPKPVKQASKEQWTPVGPGKKIGGGKFGTFDAYPTFFSYRLKAAKKSKPTPSSYRPQMWAHKTYFTQSIAQKYIDTTVNSQTYRGYQPTHVAKYAPKIGE